MKKSLLIAASLFVAIITNAQSIPNGGFEAWNSVKWEDPTGFQTSNDKNNHGGNSSYTPPANALKTTDAYHGKFGVKMTCIKFGTDTIAGFMFDASNINGNGPGHFIVQGGIPYNLVPTSVRFYYKYTIKKTDSALVLLFFKLKDSVVGSYFWKIGDTTSTYKLKDIAITGLTSPFDTIAIGFATSYLVVGNGRGMPGSVLTIDSLTFAGVASQPATLNGDFENWTPDSTITPVGWEMSGAPNAQRTTDASTGNYAIELTTTGKGPHNNQNNSGYGDDGMQIQTSAQHDSTIGGWPYNKQVDTLEFDYKYAPNDTADRAGVNISFKKNSVMNGGFFINLKAAPTYKHFVFPFNSGTTPDSVLVSLQSSTEYVFDTALGYSTVPDRCIGADFKIDNLQFKSQAVIFKPAPSLSTSVTNTTCGLNNGQAVVNVTGGTKPYSFTWTTNPVQTGDTASNLPPGQYTVTVKDKNYTEIAVVTVGPSSGPGSTLSTTSSSCSSSNGAVSVNVSGGVAPYTYSWSTGATTSSISGVAAGVYSVTVTDKGGCKTVANGAVSDNGAPVVFVDSIGTNNCVAGIEGLVNIHDTGGVGPFTYMWSNGATTQNINNLNAGTYNVTVTDNNGCAGTKSISVPRVLPQGVTICMVTVDTNNLNNVMWARSGERHIASFNIYREGSVAGVYNFAGSQPYDSLSLWVDPSAKPQTRSYRYKITEVDSCGNESPMSDEHKTMHLTVNVGLPAGTTNLIWDNYEGLTFYTYYIFRDTIASHYTVIDSIPNNGSQTYSDYYPTTNNLYYRVGIDNPGACTPTTHAKTFNASHSNTASVINTPTAVNVVAKSTNVLVYPNPVKNTVMVDARGLGASIQTITILDMTGRAVETKVYPSGAKNSTEKFDMSGYAQGIYLIKVTTSTGIFFQRVSKIN